MRRRRTVDLLKVAVVSLLEHLGHSYRLLGLVGGWNVLEQVGNANHTSLTLDSRLIDYRLLCEEEAARIIAHDDLIILAGDSLELLAQLLDPWLLCHLFLDNLLDILLTLLPPEDAFLAEEIILFVR